jgi:hypothetical protein
VFQSLGGGLLGSLAQAAVIAGTLLLVLAVVALGAFAYRQVLGDGVEWPGEGAPEPESESESEDDSVSRGDSGDEWEYY